MRAAHLSRVRTYDAPSPRPLVRTVPPSARPGRGRLASCALARSPALAFEPCERVCQPCCAHCGYSYIHVADSSDQCRHDLTKALQSAKLYNETVGRAAHVVDEATLRAPLRRCAATVRYTRGPSAQPGVAGVARVHRAQAAGRVLALRRGRLRCVADVARHEQVRLEVSLYFDELRAVLNAREAEILLELDSRGGQKVCGRIVRGGPPTHSAAALVQLSELESQRKTLAAVMHGIASCSEFTASVLAHTIDDAVALFSTKRVRDPQRPLCRPMLAPPRPARVVQTY